MPQARVESIDALKHLKTAMIKFAEGANVALGDAESEIVRVVVWLESEQTNYWRGQHRKRTDLVSRCKEQVRMKKIFKDSSGRPQSAIEEEKALKIALRKLDEADFKMKAIEQAVKRLEKEFPLYKGNVQRFATDVLVDVPAAAAHLENLWQSLDAYAGLDSPVEVTSTAEIVSSPQVGSEQTGSMARAIDEEKEPEEEVEKQE